jgi:hypothetical protein
MVFSKAPASLIGEGGKPNFGVFGEAIANVNLKDFDYRPIAPFPVNLTRSSAQKAIKRWQYMGFVNADMVLGMAVVDIGYIGSVFAYSYLREEKKVKDHSRLDPLRSGTRFSTSSVSGISEHKSKGFHLRMENDIAQNARKLTLDIADELRAELTFDEKNFEPLCVVTQNGLRGFNYCHKAAGLPVTGWVKVGGRQFDIMPETTMGILDWSAGCPARYTYWNWASGSGILKDGRRIGMNFSSGVNERAFTENVFWVDGKPVKVDTMRFDYDSTDAMKPWRITSADGKADLVFHPENERKENVNTGLLVSRFRQPFGEFEGTFLIDGKKTPVQMFGVTEEHEAKW